MKLLLVDDDVDVIEGILDGVDFQKLNFTNVYAATNAADAKDIIQNSEIDVMITDIEMPGQSGIDLLKWVREKDYSIVTIFCTCYSNFNYARKAIELQCFDFFLKPIEYDELSDRLEKACKESIKRYHSTESEKQLFFEKAARHNFWQQILSGEKPDRIQQSYLGYSDKDRFTVALIDIFFTEEEMPAWKLFGYRNIAEEILSTSENASKEFFGRIDNISCAVVKESSDEHGTSDLHELFNRIIELTGKAIDTHSAVYFTSGCTIDEIFKQCVRAKEIYNKDILTLDASLDTADYVPVKTEYEPLNSEEMIALLSSGNHELMIERINSILDEKFAAKAIDSEYMRYLRIDTTQILHNYLHTLGIDAHQFFSDEGFEILRSVSLHSILSMKTYIRYLINLTASAKDYVHQESDLVSQVKEYVSQNISDNLSRIEIAKSVYLNPDYLARIFKEETGLTLGQYILDERMKIACKKLAETKEPINNIALEVGYDNFSYFSQIFKKKTGLKPNEYRRQFN